ncbi:MAG: hypothetical protein KF812_10390 [Fimbriimonadaceae bacterium]|nr:hypothetical protein [Fimbriimonadaceae bacterium]
MLLSTGGAEMAAVAASVLERAEREKRKKDIHEKFLERRRKWYRMRKEAVVPTKIVSDENCAANPVKYRNLTE